MQVTSYDLKSTSYEFKSTSYVFKSTSYEFKSTSCEFKSTSYVFKSTSYDFKSKSSSSNPRVKRLKARIEAIKPRVILNFMSYKKFYFDCLVNGELTSHTKVLKNISTTWFWKISMWPLYYYHILAAGKLRSIDSNKT